MNFPIEFSSEIFKEPSENINVEFKKSENKLPGAFWETYSSFANTDGGIIVLGVNEIKKRTYRITGVKNPEEVIKSFWNQISDKKLISHNLLTKDDVIILKFKGKSLIEFHIPKASFSARPVYYKNRNNTYVRTDDGDRVATPEQFKYMVVDSNQYIDTELLDNYDFNDIDENSVNEYKRLYAQNKKAPEVLKENNYQFLKDIGVFRRNRQSQGKEWKLTVGGLLFFGQYNAIVERFRGFQVDYIKKKTSNSLEWIDRVSIGDMNFDNLNIFSFYQLVEKKIPNGIPDMYQQDENLTRGSYYSDLRDSVKEALVNSLMHAYYDSDRPIKITDYNEYFEFYNPGEMRVTEEQFFHGSISRTRNAVIANLFRRVGIAEKEAKGGRTIADTAINHNLRPPEINSTIDSTSMRIWKINLKSSMHGLNTVEEMIVQVGIEKGVFKIPETVKIIQQKDTKLSEYKIRQGFQSLEDKSFIIKHGKGRATYYLINQSEEAGKFGVLKMIKSVEDQWLDRK
ncbi:hypothetical protein ASU28_14075 [Lactiplantibacillus paraplantarum]|uniref:RNA-binding domain-containing protein n=1 Tax=Lactiplantibacillus paraplantarum TaxID=60520 RepID=UPI000512F256|nr:RNA-binding domain-containing protein [Lactiplantibacillus paraplantarum]ALO05396.1 hypothetical protein ASU28_14075 [Lactiplantibacillus paraplantarum]KGE74750.1 hypothetical protein HR47_11075 [Lactiplantibacillus paraplantarum]